MAVPKETPVTVPEEVTDTTGDAEENVPPPVASVNIMKVPTQTLEAPDIATGKGFTVTFLVT